MIRNKLIQGYNQEKYFVNCCRLKCFYYPVKEKRILK